MAVLRNPQRLAADVSDALPRHYGPDYNNDTFVQWDIGEKVVAAAQRGVDAAAHEAFAAGYRAGERHGQARAAMHIRNALDVKSQSRYWEPEHRWRRDAADHAQVWVVDADQEVVRSRVHHVPAVSLYPLLRKAVADWSEVPSWAGKGLPEIAAFAYDLGHRTSMDRAYTFTESSIEQYAYHRAADLGVSLKFVDADLGLKPGQRPAGFAEPAKDRPPQTVTHPSVVARSSFAAPATATGVQEPTSSVASDAAAHRQGQPSRRSR